MKKFIRLAMISVICASGLTACSALNNSGEMVTSVSINKDGSISSRIVDDFGEDYYDEEGLKSMIEDAIADYGRQSPSSTVTLKTCKADDNMINVEMEYGDYKAYSGFNGENFFAGTVQEAYEAGYDLDFELSPVDNKDTGVISKQDILNMGGNHIVIMERESGDEGDAFIIEPVRINCFDDVLYVGEGISSVSRKSVDYTLNDGTAVVLFR